MSWYVTLRIGGPVRHADFLEVLQGAADVGLLIEGSDVHASTILSDHDRVSDGADDLLSADGTLAFYAPEFRDNSFEDLEELCQDRNIGYVRVVDGDDEADGETYWWIPGMIELGRAMSTRDGEPCLLVKDVIEAMRHDLVRSLVEGATIPTLKPFSLVE